MSTSTDSSGSLSPAEVQVGKALALVHKALARMEDPARRREAESALAQAASLLDAARSALGGSSAGVQPLGVQSVSTAVAPQIAAAIAAAVSVAIEGPFRLVSVQQVTAPVVPHLNVWAVEGRTQIFMSHRIR